MAKYLFEVSWEVCNKVGGINTVLKTKAQEAVNEFGKNYITIGPMLPHNSEFIPEDDTALAPAVERLRMKRINVRIGRWDIKGKPRVILVDFKEVVSQKDKLLYQLWENFGVDSMFGGWDYDEPVLFSTACGMVIEELVNDLKGENEIFAHFHEWMTGAGMLYLRKYVPRISTVFTTHATMLGRSMSGHGVDIYSRLDEVDPMQEAKKYNVTAKHSMETVSAREADCFTAVSEITAIEAMSLLGTKVGVITPNGFNIENVPDYSQDYEGFSKSRKTLMEFASKFLGKTLVPEKTKIVSISGRYEFHNKGIDVLIESLGRLNNELKGAPQDITVVAFFLVIGAHVGVHEETRQRMKFDLSGLERFSGISTHHLGDPHHDPILNECHRLNIVNSPDDRCNIIFIPVNLDGNDGVVNMDYYEVLKGCDLGIYPSDYEPWGYTPLESIAYSVPAITTDKSGFGRWFDRHGDESKGGVIVLRRSGKDQNTVINDLTAILRGFIRWDENQTRRQKKGARLNAEKAGWKDFYEYYRQAYAKAEANKKQRISGISHQTREYQTSFPGTNSTAPRLRSFAVITPLPKELEGLGEMAYNLWWVWNSRGKELFSRLDPVLWERLDNNAVALLQSVHHERLLNIIKDKNFMSLYESVLHEYKDYLNEKAMLIKDVKNITPQAPIAYFSMEFGIHESIPTYSGGLGILAGDHLKSASDLNLPIVGISLMYKYGYFKQTINAKGEQIPEYVENNFGRMPVDIVKGKDGKRLIISIEFPGRTLFAQVWEAKVGRARLFYLDTDIDENSMKDRDITSKLYDSRSRERIEQEFILGIGGVILLNTLNIEPSVFHLNEGHSAFLFIQRLADMTKTDGIDIDTARDVVRGSTVFTTHTPVPAGNERFEKSLIENYFRNYVEQRGIPWEQFWNLGHIYAGEETEFEMTVLAMKRSNKRNSVSKLHGGVSRRMWQAIWRGFLPEEVPIGHITNGVHFQSWISDEIRTLLETFVVGMSWDEALLEAGIWKKIDDIPDASLWRIHNSLKHKLFELVKATVQNNWMREGIDPEVTELMRNKLNPNALTIGVARRFATYKRSTLILKDIERLKKILNNDRYPVQIIFAGKAHPADKAGSKLIQDVVQLSKEDDFLGKIIFVEDYNIKIARALVSGVDVWLNNPERLKEASGTSGMKAAMNGVINCSILDGWWDEAYNGENGWAIGDKTPFRNPETEEIEDSGALYDIIKDKIVPSFYTRNFQEIPPQWVRMMKNSMKTIIPVYNTHRMVRDYIKDMYEPTANRKIELSGSNCKRARQLAEWRKKIPARFSTLRINEVRVDGIHGDVMNLGDKLKARVKINRGDLTPDEILVELVIQYEPEEPAESPAFTIEKMQELQKNGNILTYEGEFTSTMTGRFKYGIRAVPMHPELSSRYDTALVYWG